ncbi:mechanosensitive ion channel family protein [Aliarcobacter skirrowii]|uniref:Mechanosensing system component YbdG n=1 Tax=Aliarcobacter skirrowii CCUG 10374 TaxID=1032239 RepID=A0AAD0SLF8_9BACT|nr:mechanosensitive ion channel domain-containing protein [Aliarcobacter skirrowii]MDD2973658.1 mechanosensitive ion channel [Aliarcobacter cryaerophilus]AXX84376.1 miniconductance mechanosensitive channel protein [Aliarcobacter skirrowii CCUG 10374]AZL53513.1 mechanosensitive ion channel [Aliarcobacter skirrowii]KAB0621448.1 mechanosensitive ion channel [Aliarcobacter skirrowii CCUG 10374]MDX4060930.1 mechanosensitive ion channel [Aliarcobacter skirrowii]
MKKYLVDFLRDFGIEPTFLVMSIAILIIISITALIIHILLHKIILKAIIKFNQRKQNLITSTLLEENLYQRLSLLFQGLVVNWQTKIWVESGYIYETLMTLSLVWISIFTLLVIYSIIDKIFSSLHLATQTPFFAMRTVIQGVKLVFGIVCVIYIVAILADKSPVAILSGLGAMSAVLMLVFKDTILGFSAGLQLSTNKMVQLGDWIEMPKYGADGDVIDIGLNVVKVRNFDKTITTIPTYALVSDSFKNWRGMRESGGRRIKRAIKIDLHSIKFLNEDDIKRLEKANLLAPYLKEKVNEIKSYNESNKFDLSVSINGRRLTNIGTLRAYILTYLKNHPNINKDMTIMVRQLSPNEYGIPLEIYCFTSTTVWVDYENIQSDIFDHIYSVLGEFDIKPYQYG